MKIENVLIRRMVEIDYRHQHRHLAGALGTLPILMEIFQEFDPASDLIVLSKGHAASALYAILETLGYHPDVTKPHPERDPANAIPCTTGSLGHGLPLAVGLAWAKRLRGEPGHVYVVIGDGETLEGTTWESLHLAEHLGVLSREPEPQDILQVYLDDNGWQGSCRTFTRAAWLAVECFGIRARSTGRGRGVPLFEQHPEWHTHTITEPEYREILASLGER